MDMYRKEIKYLIYFLILCNVSCIQPIKEENKHNEILDHFIFTEYIDNNFKYYELIHNQALDSVRSWVMDSLEYSKPFFYNDWMLDSVLIFNNDSTRFFTTIQIQSSGFKDSVIDDMKGFYGAKIDDKWYFYRGATYFVSHEKYQDSIYAPLTFDELSFVSHKSPMRGLLRRGMNGEIEVNTAKLRKKFFAGDGDFHKCNFVQSCYDSVIIAQNKRMHQKKLDPKQIARIKKKMEDSVQPPEPSSLREEKQTFFQRIFDMVKQTPDIKIFESEAWKNRKMKQEKKVK